MAATTGIAPRTNVVRLADPPQCTRDSTCSVVCSTAPTAGALVDAGADARTAGAAPCAPTTPTPRCRFSNSAAATLERRAVSRRMSASASPRVSASRDGGSALAPSSLSPSSNWMAVAQKAALRPPHCHTRSNNSDFNELENSSTDRRKPHARKTHTQPHTAAAAKGPHYVWLRALQPRRLVFY